MQRLFVGPARRIDDQNVRLVRHVVGEARRRQFRADFRFKAVRLAVISPTLRGALHIVKSAISTEAPARAASTA